MFADPFNKCDPDDISTLIQAFQKAYPGQSLRLEGLAALRKPLGFYPDAYYYDLAQVDQHPVKKVSLVSGGGKILWLDGDVESLYAFNKSYPLRLSQNFALDYVRFFFSHINGPFGTTLVVEVVDDLPFREEATPTQRRVLADRITPLTLVGLLPDDNYQIQGTFLVKNNLYSATLAITADGQVHVDPKKILAENMLLVDRILEN